MQDSTVNIRKGPEANDDRGSTGAMRMQNPLSRVRALASVPFSTLAALGVLAAGLFAFVQIADEVIEGEAQGFDEAILRALRTPGDLAEPIGPWWLKAAFQDITAVGGTAVLTLITAAA